jgi:hypothetical protein
MVMLYSISFALADICILARYYNVTATAASERAFQVSLNCLQSFAIDCRCRSQATLRAVVEVLLTLIILVVIELCNYLKVSRARRRACTKMQCVPDPDASSTDWTIS